MSTRTFRITVRGVFDGLSAEQRAELLAEAAAKAWLVERGYGHKHLRSQAEDLSLAPVGKRQRREAARKRS